MTPVEDGEIRTPREVVQQFLSTVRVSGDEVAAERVLAPLVECHQVVAEDEVTVTRTPHEYAEHVRDMMRAFGRFDFRVEELLVDGDRVYVRWRQSGHHVGDIAGYPATGSPLVEVGSAVYRVASGRIVEYWVQLDRAGLTAQLERRALHPGTPTYTTGAQPAPNSHDPRSVHDYDIARTTESRSL